MRSSRAVWGVVAALAMQGFVFTALAGDPASSSSASGSTSSATSAAPMESGVEKGTTFESTSISFSPGSATLTDQDKAMIRDLIKTTQEEQGKISRAKIAVWSDNEHPEKGNLARQDRDLAKRRITSIEEFLKKEQGVSQVKSFNMAENSSWVGRMFHREQAELDAAFARRGEAPVSNHEFRTIKDEGGASKAVIILEHPVVAK